MIAPCQHETPRSAAHFRTSHLINIATAVLLVFFLLFLHTCLLSSFCTKAVVTGVVPSSPRFLPPTIIAHTVPQSHCSSSFHRLLLTHALALSASQIVRTNLYEYAFRGARTRETNLYQARGYPDTPPGRPGYTLHGLQLRYFNTGDGIITIYSIRELQRSYGYPTIPGFCIYDICTYIMCNTNANIYYHYECPLVIYEYACVN